MIPIDWKPDFSVGDAAVDHEHRELIELVNTAAEAILNCHPEGEVDRNLGDLLRAISAHFAHEERQMQRAGYDQYSIHKADHERLLDSLRDIMDGPRGHSRATAEQLTDILESWFIDHFRIHDARLHHRLGPHEH